MAVSKVLMPKLSEAMESGKIIKWLKKEGDRVQSGDILAEVETDKADVEMEAFGGGVLRKILSPAGSTVPVGSLIGVIAEADEDIAAVTSQAGARGAGGVLRRLLGPRGRDCDVEPSRRGSATAAPRGSRRAHAVTGERPDRAARDRRRPPRRRAPTAVPSRRRREPGAR